MPAFYNELEPYAAQWLRNLSDAGHIALGTVDERSIKDLNPSDLAGHQQCHFFAGIGVWSYALRLAGIPDEFPVWTGSCPCQPFSVAGRGLGTEDERHLWPVWFNLIRECRPALVFGEQVGGHRGLEWLDSVSADLEGENYAIASASLCAAGVGSPHIRKRLYWVAYSVREGWQRHFNELRLSSGSGSAQPVSRNTFTDAWRALDSDFSGVPQRDGTSVGVERLRAKCYGNAIVAPLAATLVRAAIEAIAEQTQ